MTVAELMAIVKILIDKDIITVSEVEEELKKLYGPSDTEKIQ